MISIVLTAVSNAKGYDWSTWLMGIVRAFISGGAGAIVSGTTVMGLDPEHFNFTQGLHKTFELMGVMFLVMGVVHMMMFLQTHGAPEKFNAQPSDTKVKEGT